MRGTDGQTDTLTNELLQNVRKNNQTLMQLYSDMRLNKKAKKYVGFLSALRENLSERTASDNPVFRKGKRLKAQNSVFDHLFFRAIRDGL